MTAIVFLFCFLGCLLLADAFNATASTKYGRSCSRESNNANAAVTCARSPLFDERVKGMLGSLLTEIKKKPSASSTSTPPAALTAGGDVCASVYPYTPTQYCSCADNTGGGVVECKYPVVVGGQLIDTIYVEVVMEVCADPATLGITMMDGDTQYTFSVSITSGDTGSVPTGIMVGIPGVGDVEIVLMYVMSGNIDNLTVQLGFDLSMTVLGFTETCSGIYPEECPVWFYSQTMNFGNYC